MKSPMTLPRYLSLGLAIFAGSAAYAQSGKAGAAAPATTDRSCVLNQEKGAVPTSGIRPISMPHDTRLVVFPYDKNALFPVYTLFNRFTHFEFEDGEKIQASYINDESEWEQKVSVTGRDIFVRSRSRGAGGTMTVITNKRRYQIDLVDISGCPQYSRYQRVSWLTDAGVYEATTAQATDKLSSGGDGADKDELPSAAAKTVKGAPRGDSGGDDWVHLSRLNMDYAIEGSQDIKPVRVFDDGSQTWLQFSGAATLRPAIFSVSTEGVGEPVEYVVRGTAFVLASVYPHGLLLKLGKQEVRIRNNKSRCGLFDASCRRVGTSNITGE